MHRSESHEQLTTQTQEGRSYSAMSPRQEPEVEFRGERRPVQQDQRTSSSETPFDPDLLLLHGCRQIISLFVPVSLCMFFVVIISCTVPFFLHGSDLSLSFSGDESGRTEQKAGEGVITALIMVALIVIFTCIIVLCFKFRCMLFIKAYIFFVGFVVLFVISSSFFLAFCDSLNIFVDFLTFAFVVWNFGVIGMLSFFWKAPLRVQQVYTIFIGALMALLMNAYFPWWTKWFLLAFLAVWDLIAVLCPKGPLRILVELVQENQDPFPAIMVYSTAAGVVFMADTARSPAPADVPNQTEIPPAAELEQPTTSVSAAAEEQEEDEGGFRTHVENTQRAEQLLAVQDEPTTLFGSGRARSAVSALNNASEEGQNEEAGITSVSRNLREIQHEVMSRDDRGVKLGLGDFVFYSVLIATAAQSQDWSTILAVFVAILIGMCSTLLLLAIHGHALPALPISIAFGLVFYFCTNQIIAPFSSALAQSQAFI